LQPSTTGEPGGKETRQSVTHYIIPAGPYAKAYAKLKAKGFKLHWQSAPRRNTGQGEEGQQDEIHLPGLRTERMGKAGCPAYLSVGVRVPGLRLSRHFRR
jgi:hypothetical protein